MTLSRAQVVSMLAAILSQTWEGVSEGAGMLHKYALRNDVPDDLAAEATRAHDGLVQAAEELDKAWNEAKLDDVKIPPQALGTWTWEELEEIVAKED